MALRFTLRSVRARWPRGGDDRANCAAIVKLQIKSWPREIAGARANSYFAGNTFQWPSAEREREKRPLYMAPADPNHLNSFRSFSPRASRAGAHFRAGQSPHPATTPIESVSFVVVTRQKAGVKRQNSSGWNLHQNRPRPPFDTCTFSRIALVLMNIRLLAR